MLCKQKQEKFQQSLGVLDCSLSARKRASSRVLLRYNCKCNLDQMKGISEEEAD